MSEKITEFPKGEEKEKPNSAVEFFNTMQPEAKKFLELLDPYNVGVLVLVTNDKGSLAQFSNMSHPAFAHWLMERAKFSAIFNSYIESMAVNEEPEVVQ